MYREGWSRNLQRLLLSSVKLMRMLTVRFWRAYRTARRLGFTRWDAWLAARSNT
jgi:hypothetical protein